MSNCCSDYSRGPSYEGFLWFLRNIADMSPTVLPDGSQVINFSYCVATDLTLRAIEQVSVLQYTIAVYNLGTDRVINFAPDQTGQTYFQDLRKQFNLLKFQGGVITNASDEGTSAGIQVIDALKNITLADLQYLKSPYGREYMGIAQMYGTIWGLT